MHLTIKERVELVLMSGADGVCYYYLNCFICFGALFMAQNVCYYYLNCFICFGALFMAHPVFSLCSVYPKDQSIYIKQSLCWFFHCSFVVATTVHVLDIMRCVIRHVS